MAEPIQDELEIDNEISVANQWKPYDFLMFIEREFGVRGIDHQVLDLPADLGSIKTCLKYAEAMGRKPSSFVKYCLWLFDGLDMKQVTSLSFLPQSLKHFYGYKKAAEKVSKIVERDTKKIDATARIWLDEIRAKY